ncbi:hypothetical protein [Methanobrevibacter sp. V74]|uniref:hypothetical protein n=1 Tax=Methanobrevibacter sp. V74 TaxID=3064279 RepID=UPI00273357AB|nr:hypothetical protein [Methanobrevibacter sp. V74]
MSFNKNIITIFLFVMLSFAIISEVSGSSGAETDEMEFDQSVYPVNITQLDLPSESDANNHDFNKDVKFQNEHDSFKNSSKFDIELDGDANGHTPDNLSIVHNFNDDGKYFDGNCLIENFTNKNTTPEVFSISSNFSNEDTPMMDGGYNDFMKAPTGQLMNNIISSLLGLNNIAPNFKKYNYESKSYNKYNAIIQPCSDIKNTATVADDIKIIKPQVKKSIKKHSLKNKLKLIKILKLRLG